MFRRAMRKMSRSGARGDSEAAILRLSNKAGARVRCNQRASCAYDSLALEDCGPIKGRPPMPFPKGAFDRYDHLHSVRAMSAAARNAGGRPPATGRHGGARNAVREYEYIAEESDRSSVAHSYALATPIARCTSSGKSEYATVRKRRDRTQPRSGCASQGSANDKLRYPPAASSCEGSEESKKHSSSPEPFESRKLHRGSSVSEAVLRRPSTSDLKTIVRRPTITTKSLQTATKRSVPATPVPQDCAQAARRGVTFARETVEHTTYARCEYQRCMDLGDHGTFEAYLAEQEDEMQDEMEAEVRDGARMVRQRTAVFAPNQTRIKVRAGPRRCLEGQVFSEDVLVEAVEGRPCTCDGSSARLKAGDRIVQINENWVLTAEHACWLLKRFAGDSSITVMVVRPGASVADSYLSLTRKASQPAKAAAPAVTRASEVLRAVSCRVGAATDPTRTAPAVCT